MGFLAPWFLVGLAAIGVPVFVHLLRRNVTTPRPFSSLMFFERGIQSSTRHRRLRYLLLFVLRAALVLLAVLAFANLFVRRPVTAARGRLLLIVLDNSFSMRAGTRFTDAKQQALETLASRPPAERSQIIALGGQLEILTQPITDGAQLRSAVESIQSGDGRASFADLGRGVRSIAESEHGPIDLHLFSDMQRTSMPANFADMVLPNNVSLTLHSAATGVPPANWDIESIEAPVELHNPKDPKLSRVRAVIAGFNTPNAAKSLSLVVNGKAVATRKIDVPANGRATVEFAPLDVAYGFNRCEVRIDDSDALPADNISIFTVRRADPERVLFVHPSSDTRSANYFGAALASAPQGSFVLQSTPAEQTAGLDPSRFAFVVLSDAETIPSIFEHALEQYVAKGGGVLITLGTGSTNRARIPVWGEGVRETRDFARTGAVSVSKVDFTHSALAQAQPGTDIGGWADVRVFYAASVDPGGARVAASLSDGTPLLLDKQIGEGHLLLFTSGFENLTNDLPLHPVFVHFVDRVVRYLSGNLRLAGSALVDSYVPLRSAPGPASVLANTDVIDPEGHRPLSLGEARTAQTFRLARAGFYQIRFANGQDAVIGVNADRRESNLEPIPEDVLKLWSKTGSDGTQKNLSQDRNRTPVSLWWYVIMLALLTAVAEAVVASRHMGTQREAV